MQWYKRTDSTGGANNPGKSYCIWRVVPLLALTLLLPFAAGAQQYEVVVYGGTSAGVTAAIAAAQMGKSVALLEPGQHVGGMSVEGLGGSDIDNHREFRNSPAVGGLALEFYRRLAQDYGRLEAFEQARQKQEKRPDLWRFEPHVAERVFRAWLAEYPIAVFYDSRLQEGSRAVEKKGARIAQIRLENGRRFWAKVFIDATYEGDLLHAAGVSTIVGREANRQYGETKNGIRAESPYRNFEVEVDPYRTPGDSASGVIATIQNEPLGTPGEADARIQAYCFRACLTKDSANRIPFSQPEGYDPGQYEIYLRYLKAGGKLYQPAANIPGGKTDLGAWHDLSHNLYGMNHAYPGGSYATRGKIYREHLLFTQGLFYFLATDPQVTQLAPALQKAWMQWGLCKDEFTDNGGWPRQFYVRDARRMVSDYVITEHHTRNQNQTPVEDPVAVAYWPPDVHHVRRMVRNGHVYNEGFVFGGEDWAPFGISYRALAPKTTQVTNLLTPTCPSSSHIAYGAIRLEWTFMALGQAVGAAAGLAISQKVSVQGVPYPELRKHLLSKGQVLTMP